MTAYELLKIEQGALGRDCELVAEWSHPDALVIIYDAAPMVHGGLAHHERRMAIQPKEGSRSGLSLSSRFEEPEAA